MKSEDQPQARPWSRLSDEISPSVRPDVAVTATVFLLAVCLSTTAVAPGSPGTLSLSLFHSALPSSTLTSDNRQHQPSSLMECVEELKLNKELGSMFSLKIVDFLSIASLQKEVAIIIIISIDSVIYTIILSSSSDLERLQNGFLIQRK